MGTTIVTALFQGPEVVIGHAGDSRAYLVRDGAIQQLTTDHTYVQELVEKKQISADEAMNHPQAHVLTRCIGSEPQLQVSIKRFWIWQDAEIKRGDCLALVTDGLYSLVSEVELANLISEKSPQRACVELVELAKSRGGYDNITAAIIPLGGQLRNEPPIGYVEQKKKKIKVKTKSGKVQTEKKNSFVQLFFVVVMLSVLSSLLTILGMAVSMGD